MTTSTASHPTAEVALAAERAVLGTYLVNPDATAEHVRTVTSEYFQDLLHRQTWDVIQRLQGHADAPDAVVVADALVSEGAATDSYGYVADLAQCHVPAHGLSSHVAILHKHWVARNLSVAAGSVMDASRAVAKANTEDVAATVAEVQALVNAVGEQAGAHASLVQVGEAALDTLDGLNPDRPIDDQQLPMTTGLQSLDTHLNGGIRPSEFIVVAARPGMGKSTLANGILIANAVKMQIPCAMFSLEMSLEDCTKRILSATAEVPIKILREAKVSSDSTWERLSNACQELIPAPLYIDTTSNVTLNYFTTQVTYLVRRHGVRLVVIDYLQLMSGKAGMSRQEIVSEISRGMKVLANELNIAIIAVSQLNRGPEQRQDKRPMVSDLRESGQIEQDADGVWLIYREDSYDPETTRAGEADIIFGKLRHGEPGAVPVALQLQFSRFRDMPTHAW